MNNLTIEELKKQSKTIANEHGWLIQWNKEKSECNQSNIPIKILSIGDALCLCHSELSEALDDFRNDNKEHFAEEIADEFIRLFHLCGDLNIDIESEIMKKMEKNKQRPLNHGRKNY